MRWDYEIQPVSRRVVTNFGSKMSEPGGGLVCSRVRFKDLRYAQLFVMLGRPGSDTPSGRHAPYPPMYSYHHDYI